MEELSKPGAGSYRVVALPGGRRGYAEPIFMRAPCLTCHGENIDPAALAKLQARYPADAARGFREGDFRGVFFAELD